MRKFVMVGALALPLVLGTGVAQANPLDFLASGSGTNSSATGSTDDQAPAESCDSPEQRDAPETGDSQENCESKDNATGSNEDINGSTEELAGSAEGVLRLGTAVVGIAALLQNPALAGLFGLLLAGSSA